jgi:hypothetical protein
MDHASAESARPLVLSTGLLEDAIKTPIDFSLSFPRLLQHAK